MKKLLTLLSTTALMTIPVMGIVSCGTGTPTVIDEKINVSTTTELREIVELSGTKENDPASDVVQRLVFKQLKTEGKVDNGLKYSELIASDFKLDDLSESSVLNIDKDYSGHVVFKVKEDSTNFIGEIAVKFTLKIIVITGDNEIIFPGNGGSEGGIGDGELNEDAPSNGSGGSGNGEGEGGSGEGEGGSGEGEGGSGEGEGGSGEGEGGSGEGNAPCDDDNHCGPGEGGSGNWQEDSDENMENWENYMTDLTRLDLGNGKINLTEFNNFKLELLENLKNSNNNSENGISGVKYPDSFFADDKNFKLTFAEGWGFDKNGFERGKNKQKMVFSLKTINSFEHEGEFFVGNFKFAFQNVISNFIDTNVIFDLKYPPKPEDYDNALLKELKNMLIPTAKDGAKLNYKENTSKENLSDWYEYNKPSENELPNIFGGWAEIKKNNLAIAKFDTPNNTVLNREVNDIRFNYEKISIKSIDLKNDYGQADLSEEVFTIGENSDFKVIEDNIWNKAVSQIDEKIRKYYGGYDATKFPDLKREYFLEQPESWIQTIKEEYEGLDVGTTKEVTFFAEIDNVTIKQSSFIGKMSVKVKLKREPIFIDQFIPPIKLLHNGDKDELRKKFFTQIEKNLHLINNNIKLNRNEDGLKNAFEEAYKTKNIWVEYEQFIPEIIQDEPIVEIAKGKIQVTDKPDDETIEVDLNSIQDFIYRANESSEISAVQVENLSNILVKHIKDKLTADGNLKRFEGVSDLREDWTNIGEILMQEIGISINNGIHNREISIDLKSILENSSFTGKISVINLKLRMT